MSGMRNRKPAVRYNPSDHGLSDKARNERDDAPPTTRSKRGSLKQPDRFDFDRDGRNDTNIKRARGETPGPTDAQEALDREAQEELDRSIEARFKEQSTGAFEVHGDPYRLAKDGRPGVCRYNEIKDGKQGIICGIGSFVKVLVPPDYDNETRVQQFAATDPWIEYIAWLEAVEIAPQEEEPKCHLHWLKDCNDLQKGEQAKMMETTKKDENSKWAIIVNHNGMAVSTDVPLRWVQGPVYVRANCTIIHEEGAFIDCVNCTEWLLNGLAGLVTGLPDVAGHRHAVGSVECPEPVPETIEVVQEFNYEEMKFQNVADFRPFNVKDKLRRTLAYVTLEEFEDPQREPLQVRLPIPNENGGGFFAIHVSKFPSGLNIQVGEALEITTESKKGNQTRKLGQIVGYEKGVARCLELLPANKVQKNVGDDYDMNFMHFPHMLFMTDNEFHLKKFQSRHDYRCRNVTVGVAASIDSYSHMHTEYVLHQGLRKNGTSWDVVRLDFVDMSNISVPPHCAIPSIKPQTCIFNALTNMVEELKDLIKNQSNCKSYKTVPFPAVWAGFITELSQKGTVQPNPPYGQLVYHISASRITRIIKATGGEDSVTVLDMCCYDYDGRKLFSVPDLLKFTVYCNSNTVALSCNNPF